MRVAAPNVSEAMARMHDPLAFVDAPACFAQVNCDEMFIIRRLNRDASQDSSHSLPSGWPWHRWVMAAVSTYAHRIQNSGVAQPQNAPPRAQLYARCLMLLRARCLSATHTARSIVIVSALVLPIRRGKLRGVTDATMKSRRAA